MTVPNARLHALAVKQALQAAHLSVGDGTAEGLTPPYVVFYDIGGGGLDGPMSDPDADVEYPFQLTCVAETPAEARATEDTARQALANVAVAGRRVMRVSPDGAFGDLRRDDTTGAPSLFYLTPRWRLHTTPV